jgi:catechol O-methyltransferase
MSRPQQNGTFAFHEGTEDELAQYVQDNMSGRIDAQTVLDLVDEFCINRHWMMNVGNLKGKIVDDAVRACDPTTILELGTYCGYSAIRMCLAARALEKPDFKLITIDPHPQRAAQILFHCAGLSKQIVQLRGEAKDIISTLAQPKVDLVFIDHDKASYLPDLKRIESSGLLRCGSYVVADNVIVFRLSAYLRHVAQSGLYKSNQTHRSFLEYDTEEDHEDGVNVAVYK